MKIIQARSAAQAFLKYSNYLLTEKPGDTSLIEEINGIIEIENFIYEDFEEEFDLKFREIFGDERIDYAKSVSFMKPIQNGDSFMYPTIKEGWKNSYWGRMTNWENKHNQVETILNTLKQGKNVKRCEMIIYHPTFDRKKMFGQPCMLSVDFKPRNKNLYLNATFRSQRITKSGYADYTALIEMGHWLCKHSNQTLKKVTNIAHSLHLGGAENNELKNTKEIVDYFKKSKYSWIF